jgi:hypothetical protein
LEDNRNTMEMKKQIKKTYEKPVLRVVSIASSAQTLGIGCKTTDSGAIGQAGAPPCAPAVGTPCVEPGS